MTPDPRTIAAGLSEAQRRVLIAAKPSTGDARVFVPAHVERKQWPAQMIDTYSVAFRRLTPLGLAVRDHLLEKSR